jgi:hypothetical protein
MDEQKPNLTNLLQPVYTGWFDKNPQKFLMSESFKFFEKVSGIALQDLISLDPTVKLAAQERIIEQSVIAKEIRNEYAGYKMPLLYYTHDLRLGQNVSKHNPEQESLWFQFDMGDSLRRRHVALSKVIIPNQIKEIFLNLNAPLVVANLGSGIGLDVVNAIMETNGQVKKVLNYDNNLDAIDLGKKITDYLEIEGKLKRGIVEYVPKNLLKNNIKNDLSILIGIICGLKDQAAVGLLSKVYGEMNYGGRVIVSSSNYHMMETDPLPNFLIQHLGKANNPLAGWGLNFRTREKMYDTLTQAGFRDVEVYDDANYPGKENLSENSLLELESIPAQALGLTSTRDFYSLPPKAILDKNIGYNWLAIGKKI